jgi:hypothetical protein
MEKEKYTVINGQAYNAITGLPINMQDDSRNTDSAQARSIQNNSSSVHSSMQKSSTLNRRFVKKTTMVPLKADQTKAQQMALEQFKKRQAIAAQKNLEARQKILTAHRKGVIQPLAQNMVSPIAVDQAPAVEIDAPVAVPPANVQFANDALMRKNTQVRHLTAAELKEKAIQDAFDRAAAMNLKPVEPRKQKKKYFWKNKRFVSIMSMCIAITILGGYLMYINVPDISIRVAAMRAGIDASYPSYQPSGYSLKGLVAYKNNGVEMAFENGIGGDYMLTQRKSAWDSSALLANYVRPNWDGSYSIAKEHGLIIYINDGGATWVNGGILYIIESSNLSDEQVRSIATSL